ncbi:hypothetical protein D3C83_12580 [compost metagenome]
MIASPMNLSMVPYSSVMQKPSAPNSVLSIVTSAGGVKSSLTVVKLRTSENMMVSSRVSPPSWSFEPLFSIWIRSAGST